jgi:glutathione S-transferase
MKLYCSRLSPSTRRVLLTAFALDTKLEEQALDLLKGEHKAPDYLKLNPNGSIPTLVDGDFVLTESRAIMQYLALQRSEQTLLPSEIKARADVSSWLFWDAAQFSGPISAIGFEKVFKGMLGMGGPDAGKVDEALASYRRYAAVIERRLSESKFVSGNALSLADLSIAATLMYAEPLELPLAETPNLQGWFKRMTATPAWQKTA